MCVGAGTGVGVREGASDEIPESVRGLVGLGSWGTVATRDDVGELTVEITLCRSRSTSSDIGGVVVVVAMPRPHPPSLLSSSSGVRSERKSCMRRSVVAGSLS